MIYLDNAATTAVDPRVVAAMAPFWTEEYGNPSSIYGLGRHAAAAMEDARSRVAAILNCTPMEVTFTGCGSESDNLALRGVGLAQAARGRRHLITTPIEHHAVLHTANDLAERFDFEVTYVPVDRRGWVDPDAVRRAIRSDTALISVMYANNEVGTIEPIAEIGAIAREHGIAFHTDAVQAGGYLALDVRALNVDLLALSAHKFHGPKGIGLLYVRHGTRFAPVLTGGGQERGRRPGTENVPYIVGLATALELAQAERHTVGAHLRVRPDLRVRPHLPVRQTDTDRLAGLRDHLARELLARIAGAELTGHPTQRLPGHVSLVIRDVEAEALLIALDLAGVAASSGSACASGLPTPSHVLTALGYSPQEALGALRLTLGRQNTDEDVEFVISELPQIVSRLRHG